MPTEAELWERQRPVAERALDLVIDFLGCRMGSANQNPLTPAGRGRLLTIVRAVSIVESRHGTVGANQPQRDPLQSGNPADSWWRELTGQSGQGSRFRRLPPRDNYWANEIGARLAAWPGFDPAAALSRLADPRAGHGQASFSPNHSYVWGILYLIHRINSEAGEQSYQCGGLARDRLINGAVSYNGGGDPAYRRKIEAALTEIGGLSLAKDSSEAPAPDFKKDQFDAFMSLADFRRNLKEARVARQWQGNFTIWAGLGALVWKADAIGLPLLAGVTAVAVAFHVYWIHWFARRAEADQRLIFAYQNAAAHLLGLDEDLAPGRSGVLAHPMVCLQFLVTLALGSAVILLKHVAVWSAGPLP